jgi:hypothetical protein
MIKDPFSFFCDAETDEQLQRCKQQIITEGFSTFFKLLDRFEGLIKSYTDEQLPDVQRLLVKAKTMFPTPGQFSPSWEHVWDEYDSIIQVKTRISSQILPADRSGEWQVVMDNPFTSQEVVCYPSLTFIEAIYLYAYFLPKMEKNEYLRLQKVQTLIMEHHPYLSIEKESSQKTTLD